jgi:putative ABC transport system ATP-binding protein
VLDNVLMPSLARPDPEAKTRAEQLIERFGMWPRRHHRPAELSTGERQRTALARAMMNRPRLLLADEPTGNLDPRNGQIVLDALAAFTEDGGSVLMVSHDSHAAGSATRIVRMEDGTLAANRSGAAEGVQR